VLIFEKNENTDLFYRSWRLVQLASGWAKRFVMSLPATMAAARMHEVGGPLVVEQLDTPKLRDGDVLIRVRACGIVPNLVNVLRYYPTLAPQLPLPRLPAIFGLDPAGEVVAIGTSVRNVALGERVYVNPARSCGTCRHCSSGDPMACEYFTFNGYFGFSQNSHAMFERYPYGGLAQYMTAPPGALVKLPDSVSFHEAARFGYIGTAYSGLRKAKIGPGSSVLINGASGTLGVSAVLSALALGATKIFGTGRNTDILRAVKDIAPDRIEVFSLDEGSLLDWIRAQTNGVGVDATIDCLGPGASHATFLDGVRSVRRGGYVVNAGAVSGEVSIDVGYMMVRNMTLVASLWFTTEEGRQLAALASNGSLKLSVFEHSAHPLEQVNEALALLEQRRGGFSNFVITP
jgi:threonine dehydrogenase-like Zn-dependent dehydrogenase